MREIITKHVLAIHYQKPLIKVQTGFSNRETATPFEKPMPLLVFTMAVKGSQPLRGPEVAEDKIES